ncbi:MAG: LamG domain-containing protein [Gammaproteobacteria bacterium]
MRNLGEHERIPDQHSMKSMLLNGGRWIKGVGVVATALALSACGGDLGNLGLGGAILGDGGGGGGGGDPVAAFAPVHNLTRQHCAGCHSESPTEMPSPMPPMHAHSSLETAYQEAKGFININALEETRMYAKMVEQQHQCWTDCTVAAQEMMQALQQFRDAAGGTVSQAQALKVASGPARLIEPPPQAQQPQQPVIGNLAPSGVIAQYRFQEGSGTLARDTSGANPAVDLTLTGGVGWRTGGGLRFSGAAGQSAYADATGTSRIFQSIAGPNGTGQYTVETWINAASIDASADPSAGLFGAQYPNIVNYGYVATNANTGLVIEAQQLSSFQGSAPLMPLFNPVVGQTYHVVVSYSPDAGRHFFVNGTDTGVIEGPRALAWAEFVPITVGNDWSGNAPFTGDVMELTIYNRALNPQEIAARYAQSSEQYVVAAPPAAEEEEVEQIETKALQFDISQLVNIPNTYIEMDVGTYDAKSYIFAQPRVILGGPGSFPIEKIRVAVNGAIPLSAQVFANLKTTVTASGQQLSRLGTIMPIQDGPAADVFALTFERIGTLTNVMTPPPPEPARAMKPQPSTEVGISTFDEIYANFAALTGVDPQNQATRDVYQSLRSSLPTSSDAMTLNAGIQTAITKLGSAFCQEILGDQNLATTHFGNNQPAVDATYYENLHKLFFQGGSKQPTVAELQSILDTLVVNLDGANVNANGQRASVCTAVAASSGVFLRD